MSLDQTMFQWRAIQASLPDANYGRHGVRDSGEGHHPVLRLALTELCFFRAPMPRSYAGGGLRVHVHTLMTSATANDIKLEVSFERIGDGSQDLDADGFATAQNSGDVAVNGTSGIITILDVAFSAAEADAVAAGEAFRIKIERVAVAGTDATGDLEIRWVEVVDNTGA